MRLRFLTHHNPPLLWTIIMACATGTGAAQGNTTCPASLSAAPALPKAGYRVASVHWDPLLRQRWAKLVSCAHPERPAIAMLMSPLKQDGPPSVAISTARQLTTTSPVVHAGDLVRLWSQEGNLRIEASGIAEASGAPGTIVRIRLLHSGLDGQYQEQNLQGVVRGPHDVEMQR
jgi:hypothetical protein